MTNNDSILLNEIAQYMHAISQLKIHKPMRASSFIMYANNV